MSKRVKISLIIAIILALAFAVLFFLFNNNDTFEQGGKQGSWEGKSQSAIEADKNTKVGDGQMAVSIVDTIYIENGEGKANIENIEANKLNQIVTITLDDTNEKIYESGLIRPGYTVEKISPNKSLPVGKYNATATFKGIDNFENEQGSVQAKIKVVVK